MGSCERGEDRVDGKEDGMKATVMMPVEINVDHIIITVPVRYEEEDIPNDFPLRHGDVWSATVDMDTGKIDGWPSGKSGILSMKVCDEGTYELRSNRGERLAMLEGEYVPHGVVPGEYGDYIKLDINENGFITNWPDRPNVTVFFNNLTDDLT